MIPTDLHRTSVRGALALSGVRAFRVAVAFGAAVAMARLISPADFGLFSMAMCLPAVTVGFSALGLNQVIVPRADLSERTLSAMFWLGVGWSVLLAVLCVALSPLMSRLFGEHEVMRLMWALAVLFPLTATSVQQMSLLHRQLRFGAVASIQLSADLSARAAGLAAAWAGAGVWSLVLVPITEQVVSCALTWRVVGFRPHRPTWETPIREELLLGVNTAGASLVPQLVRNADAALLGLRWGPVEVGLYSRVYAIFLAPAVNAQSPVIGVMLAGLGRVQHDTAAFSLYLVRSARALSWLTTPVAALGIVAPEAIVAALLGPEWRASAPVLRALSVGGLLQSVVFAVRLAYVAKGRASELMRLSLISAATMLLAFCAGLPWAATGVATAWSVGFIAVLVITTMHARVIGVTVADITAILRGPLLAAAGAAAISIALVESRVLERVPGLVLLMILASVFGTAALVGAGLSGDLKGLLALRRRGGGEVGHSARLEPQPRVP